MAGLNLGGPDKNPATPPNPKPEESPAEQKQPESEATTQPTAAEIDAAASPETPKTVSEQTDAKQAMAAKIESGATVNFSSHPIMRYTVGKFAFENGLLTLKGDEIDEFRKVLAGLPASERHRIKELDVSAAEAQVRAMLDVQGKATKSIDSSTGDRAPNNQVGTGTLESGGGAA